MEGRSFFGDRHGPGQKETRHEPLQPEVGEPDGSLPQPVHTRTQDPARSGVAPVEAPPLQVQLVIWDFLKFMLALLALIVVLAVFPYL